MTKNADFGPNLAVFGPKILIFMGVSKSFGTNITKNHQDNLSAFLDIGALSGGPWIFHVKFCPGLRENAEMSVIKISLLQNLPSFSQKFQLFSVMFCPF